jgi:predicted AAA+ superfamily ATPase
VAVDLVGSEFVYFEMCRREEIDPILEQSLLSELRILEEVSQLTDGKSSDPSDIKAICPNGKNSPADYVEAYQNLIGRFPRGVRSVFEISHVFHQRRSAHTGRFSGSIRLSDLKGYERERQRLSIHQSLLNGKPAANTLLYGDAGTGKSSTVKAIVNEYADLGLRLIEIRKNQFLEIPAVIESLHRIL